MRTAATATALASLLALSTVPAIAEDARPDVYAGEASASAFELRLTGPAEIMGQLTPDGSDTLVQRISLTSARLGNEVPDTVSTRLGEGILAPLNEGATAEGTDAGRRELSTVSHGPITAEGGVLEWEIIDDTMSRSFSELAMLNVSLAPVLAELPDEAREPLQQVVADATATVNDLVGDLNGVLGTIEETINEVDDQTPVDIPEILPEALPVVPDVTNVDLLTARKLWSEAKVEAVDGLVRSTASGGVVELTLLGGVVRVPALQYTSIAESGGAPGTATARTIVETIAVQVGDYQVGLSGTELTVGDVTVDLTDPDLQGVPLGDALDEVQTILQDLIAAGGLTISQGSGTSEVDEEFGESATASTAPFALRLRPLQAAAAPDTIDLSIVMLPTAAGVAAAPVEVLGPDPDPAPEPQPPALPRTGGGASLLGLLAIAGATALRRRQD